jgi:peptide/nickel transport system substrate-binding protein
MYPLVAQSVESPPDRSFIVFNLDPRARFSDGHRLTATTSCSRSKLLKTRGKPFLRASYGQVSAVSVENEHRIRST